MKTTVEAIGKGHFEVEYMDGLAGTGFYDSTLAQVISAISRQVPYREPKSISWVTEEA